MSYEYKIFSLVVDTSRKDSVQASLNLHAKDGFRVIHSITGQTQGGTVTWLLLEKEVTTQAAAQG